jgi:cytochrome c
VHAIAYRSVDDSGNVEATKSCKVRIDTTAPATADDAGVGWHHKARTVTLTAADPRSKANVKAGIAAGSAGVAYTEYSSDGGATWTQGGSFAVPAPADHSGDGAQQILVRAADAAGNVAPARVVTVRIDTRKPQPRAAWAARVARGHRASLRFYVSDARPGSPSATVTVKVRTLAGRSVKTLVVRGPVGRSLSARFVCWLARGSYRFSVYATDAAGNTQVSTASNRLRVR